KQWLTLLSSLVLLAIALAYYAGAFHGNVTNTTAVPAARMAGSPHTVSVIFEPQFESVPGTVRATDETLIGARIMANVLKVHVRAGSRVEQGDVLIELEAAALTASRAQREQEVVAAMAALENARTARDRAVSLIGAGSISQAAHDDAITSFRVATANFERAQRAVAEATTALSYARIVAPMSGTVVERYIEPGDTATPGRTLLKLYNPGRLRIEATLRESLVQRVGTGDVLRAHVDALDEALESRVEEIVPAADPGSRTFTLKALVPTIDGLFPGMFARLAIPLGAAERILVPSAAVSHNGQIDFVHVRTDEGDVRRLVRLGAPHGDLIEVRSGLRPGEVIVVTVPEQ
ncbi:MAG: efflux RND transporter periplasmic adaptor subunit, partial [Gammaproteobacteria bacterium]|nr:efflux RND transporter periplasmic adaptor subunit [Gammaproteobacteria bacterium]